MSRRGTAWMGAPFVLALLVASARPDADLDPGAVERRAAELEKARTKLALRVDEAIQALAAPTAGAVVAALDARPFFDLPEHHENAKVLGSSLMHRFLRAGLLVYPHERARRLEVPYAYGKLPKGRLASDADLAALAQRNVRWLLVTRLFSDGPGSRALLELYDVTTGKRTLKAEVRPVPTDRFTMSELLGPDPLPARNLRILWFAIESFGRTVDRGECWDLPAHPIGRDGGKVEGYRFGREIPWEEGLPGDVITFGSSGETGGHVVVLLRWTPDRSQATVLHQNWGGRRHVLLDSLGGVEGAKQGQHLTLWRP